MECVKITEVLQAIDYSSFLSALLGAGFGAYAAHWLALKKDAKFESSSKYSIATKAQIQLIEQLNFIKNLKQQNLDPIRDSVDRVQKFRRVDTPLNRNVINVADISFLLETGDPNFLLELSVTERNYISTLDALEALNMFKKELEKRVVDYDPDTGNGSIPMKAHEKSELKEMTDNLFEFTDKSETKLKESIIGLKNAIKRSFPKKKAFDFAKPRTNKSE